MFDEKLTTPIAIQDATKPVKQRFIIAGNTSYSSGKAVPTIAAITAEISKNLKDTTHIIFTGDNINGKWKDSLIVKKQLDRQIKLIKYANGKSFMVPGNYDWDFKKTKGLEFIEDYLEDNTKQEDILQPNNGCPLESIEIGDDVQLIIVDSQWYIQNWYLHPTMNDKCDIKSREKLLEEIAGELKKNSNKTILFVVHHPIFTNGLHGGRFAFRDHIFPVQGNIPLPGIATLVAQVRSQGGISIQDRFNKQYRKLADNLVRMLDEEDLRTVVISGHEETLQYIEQGNIKQIVSSAGSETKPVSVSDNGLFSYGGNGFASLEILDDESVWVSFFGVDEMSKSKLLFKKEIIPARPKVDLSGISGTFPKTIKASVYEQGEVEVTDFFESFWGDHYREVYGTKVEAPIAILDTLYGGLEVVRPGGGHQTRSLRLVSIDGKEYNMRALRKSAVQFLETTQFKGINGNKYFDNTVPQDLIQDFYTAAHPYGAFAVPALAKAVKVYYTTPELFYVPKQKALGKYAADYGDELYMIVERPTDDYDNKKNFGYPDDVESTDDLLMKIREDENNSVDEETYIRARIFDMLIGDWDRHSDQWRWAEFEEGEGKVFVPIPRDRDQVFANFDGSFLDGLRSLLGAVNQFGVYGEDIGNIKWFNEAASKLDRALIKRSDRAVWMEQVKIIQNGITPEVVEKAFATLPKETQGETTEEIKEKLLARKDNLESIVSRYYNHYSKFQMLTGTDKDDHFVIIRKPNGITQIKAYRIKDGEKGAILFDREFNSEHTEDIWLYGLDDDDVFEIGGDGDHLIKVSIIGGQNKDVYKITNGKKVHIYDHRARKNEVEKRNGARVRFSKFYDTNIYDYHKKPESGGGISLSTSYNEDTGSLLSLDYEKSKSYLLRNPFTNKTQFIAKYSFINQGIDLQLNKWYAGVFSDFNLAITTRFTSKNYTENFFGYGNESSNKDNELSLDYNRVNTSIYHAGLGVERKSAYGSYFQIKFDFDSVELFENGANFLKTNASQLFGQRNYFAVPNITYQFKNFDIEEVPSKGMEFHLNGGAIDNLDNANLTAFIKSGVSFYNALLSSNKLVLNTNFSTYMTYGDRPEFYQNAQLGANTGLRGYRDNRFTGDGSILGSANLVYSFNKIKTFFLPLDFSIYGGYDNGKVWVNGVDSAVWHDSYGGGFTIKWTNAMQGRTSYFVGEESGRFQFSALFSY